MTPGCAVRHASVARHVTDCATRPGKGIINPIQKSNTVDMKDHLSYRGITLSNSMYKLYRSVINDSLSKWVEDSDMLADKQNRFRNKTSTIDHLLFVNIIIETRKKV